MDKQNPHAIGPSEKLTPQQLLERYLLFHVSSDSWGDSRKGEDCDRKLFQYYLCCEPHLEFKAENDGFFRYFVYLGMLPAFIDDFDINTLAKMIHDSKLEIDEPTRRLLTIYCGSEADQFFDLLGK